MKGSHSLAIIGSNMIAALREVSHLLISGLLIYSSDNLVFIVGNSFSWVTSKAFKLTKKLFFNVEI